jgi:hypothetical protein
MRLTIRCANTAINGQVHPSNHRRIIARQKSNDSGNFLWGGKTAKWAAV